MWRTKIEVKEEQRRVSKHIELGWIEQSKENKIVSEWMDKIKARGLYLIGDRTGVGADPEEVEEEEV